MSEFWKTQTAIATNGMIETAGAIAAAVKQRQADTKAERDFRAGYAVALKAAKKTGVFPEKYQATVTEDQLGRQVGIKVVALRELGKQAPNHPLVVSQVVRSNIATQTLINYNNANRPADTDFNHFAPSDTAAQKIYSLTMKPSGG